MARRSHRLGEVAARAALVLGDLVRGRLPAQYGDQLVDDRDEEDRHADHEADCGIQIGILIMPCATSLNFQLS